jgi:CRISPR/Cas system-associated protein Cas10 (large subunit of type III CRISPR-Cas system)
MKYKIIKMISKTGVVKYRFEIFVEFGEHTEVIAPHYSFLTEQKAIAEAKKEIRRQEREMKKVREIASK